VFIPDNGNNFQVEILLILYDENVEVRGQGERGCPVHHQYVKLPRIVGK
jgi:hypothetical protein